MRSQSKTEESGRGPGVSSELWLDKHIKKKSDCTACVLCMLSPHSREQGIPTPSEPDSVNVASSVQLAVAMLEAEWVLDWHQRTLLPRFCCSGGESCHLQRDALPELLGLLASLQVLQDIVELHHTHRCQAESTASAADDVDKVIIISRCQMDEPVMDVL